MPQDSWVWGGSYNDNYFALNQAILDLSKSFYREDCVVSNVENAVKRLDNAVCAIDSYVECRTRNFESRNSKI